MLDIEKNVYLKDLTLEEFKKFSPLFEADIYEAIKPETCIATRNSQGGTSYRQVEIQIELARSWLEKNS